MCKLHYGLASFLLLLLPNAPAQSGHATNLASAPIASVSVGCCCLGFISHTHTHPTFPNLLYHYIAWEQNFSLRCWKRLTEELRGWILLAIARRRCSRSIEVRSHRPPSPGNSIGIRRNRSKSASRANTWRLEARIAGCWCIPSVSSSTSSLGRLLLRQPHEAA